MRKLLALVWQNLRWRRAERRDADALSRPQRIRIVGWRAMADPRIKPPRRVQ